MLALSVLYAAGLSIVGVDFALLIGLIAGLVSFVPYLGLIGGCNYCHHCRAIPKS